MFRFGFQDAAASGGRWRVRVTVPPSGRRRRRSVLVPFWRPLERSRSIGSPPPGLAMGWRLPARGQTLGIRVHGVCWESTEATASRNDSMVEMGASL